MTGIVVAGMHRSGTSVTARLLAEGGWHPGESVLVSETERYEEDASFVALHRAWLGAHLPPGEGHPDWGISDGGSIDLDALAASERMSLVTDARAFVDRRDSERDRWAAKDPRAALFLPIWAEIETLRFVLVYRNPWDVVASAVRLGSDPFCRRPRLALGAWLDHNRRLLAFAQAHRSRCFVLASERVTAQLSTVWAMLHDAIGFDGDDPTDFLDPARYEHRDGQRAIAMLYRSVHSEVCDVLDRLDSIADLPRRADPVAVPAPGATPGGTLAVGTGVQVIIPCRDDGDFVLEAVASVDECARLARTKTGQDRVELTIVDDGSSDSETVRIIDVLRAGGRQVISTNGIGLAAARNLAMSASATRAIIPLDADNRLHTPLVDALEMLEHDRADVVHGPWRRFGMDDGLVDPPMMVLDSLLPGNTIDACALISRDLLERLGGWDPELPFWEDWDLWLGAIGAGARVRRVDEATFDYLVRPDSLSTLARRDLMAHKQVVQHVAAKHVRLLGETSSRLVIQIHMLEVTQIANQVAFSELEGAYRDLEVQQFSVADAYRKLKHAYRALGRYQPEEPGRSSNMPGE